jgi:hypothetical protein
MKAGPFKVDEQESVIRLAKKSPTVSVPERSTGLLDQIIRVITGD